MSEIDADLICLHEYGFTSIWGPLGRRLATTWPTVVDPHVPQGMIFVVFDPARWEYVAMVHPSYEEGKAKRGIRR